MYKTIRNFILPTLVAIAFFQASSFAQSETEMIDQIVTQRGIKAKLTFLASDALQGRATGKNGNDVAATYIATHLMALGVDTLAGISGYYQNIPFTTFTPPDTSSMLIGEQYFGFGTDFFLLNGHKTRITSQPVHVGFGSAEEIAEHDLRFKIAIVNCGDGVSNDPRDWIEMAREKRARLKDAGAAAVIELYNNSSFPWRFLRRIGTQEQTSATEVSEISLPHLWMGQPDSLTMVALKNSASIIVLDLEAVERRPSPSANVMGIVPGTDPALKDEYIVFTAHYDHVGIGRPDATGDNIYNGARDNAVGTTAILSLAEYVTEHPFKRSSIFILFTAEELGLLGSSYFIENSPVPLDQIKYCYNIDNGGYNDTTIISVIGLTRTEAQADIAAACAAYGVTAIEDAAGEQGLFDRSDNVNFARVGIPAPTFSLGFTAFDEEIMKYYHQPGDEVESLNMDYIEKYVKSYILSASKIANGEKAPFWIEGDKYYEKGLELYGQ